MKGVLATAAVAASVLALSLSATAPNAQPTGKGPPLLTQANCKFGPVAKSFGGTPWLVYGCNDGRSIRLVAASGSVLEGYVISVRWDNHYGEYVTTMTTRVGTTSEDLKASYPAATEVGRLSASDIEALFAEAKSASDTGADAKLCRNAEGKAIKCRKP
jgi:hypothetical protein